MAFDKLKELASSLRQTKLNGSVASKPVPPHPLDPLSPTEIERAVSAVRKEKGDALFFNAVTLQEPRKKDMLLWFDDSFLNPVPARIADIVAIGKGSKVFDGLVDLSAGVEMVIKWEATEGVQPLVSSSPCLPIVKLCSDDSVYRSPWKI